MKLYFRPGACSLSPHIVLRELGLPFTLDLVDRQTRKSAAGVDFNQVNPKGYVPAIELDDGQVLTEGAAIVQYLADQKPEAKLIGRPGTLERARAVEWLTYVSSELHKSFGPLFGPKTPEEYKAILREALATKYKWVDSALAGKEYLVGDDLTVADAYLYTILRWSKSANLDVATFPNLKAYYDRVEARPAVAAALAAEKPKA